MRSKGRHKKAIIVLLAVIMLGIVGCGTKNAAPAPDVSKLELTDNKDERLKEVFQSDLVITLDELPKFE